MTVTDLTVSVPWYERLLGTKKVWQARLEGLGIPHGEVVDAHYGSGLSFRDPDNIALELFAPPG